MNAIEADELYQQVLDLFPRQATPERAFRLRGHFIASELPPSEIRELVFLHRETHEYLTESALLADLARAAGREIDPAKKAVEDRIQQRRDQMRAWKSKVEEDQGRLDQLAAMTAEQLADLRGRALAKIQSESIRTRLAAVEYPLQSPTLAGFMLIEAGLISER